MKSVKVDDSVNINRLARATPGFSGADLANLINEAAIHASKLSKNLIDIHDFDEAHDKIILGRERVTVMMSEEELDMTAYHEAGHTLALLMQPEETEPLHKVTIIPRGDALGLTCWLPLRDKYTETKDQFLASIVVACGGRAAEELVFNKVSSGPYSDFHRASDIARKMVRYYGMSDEVGPVIYGRNDEYSQYTAQLIDQAVRRIIDDCYDKARMILIENRDKLNLLAKELRDKETLQAAEIYELLGIEPRESLDLKTGILSGENAEA